LYGTIEAPRMTLWKRTSIVNKKGRKSLRPHGETFGLSQVVNISF
jgi:hypothetical protein